MAEKSALILPCVARFQLTGAPGYLGVDLQNLGALFELNNKTKSGLKKQSDDSSN